MSNRQSSIVNRHSDDELISAWLDGRLAGAELAAFEARLRAEPALRRQVDATRLLVATARALPAQPLPRDFTLPIPAATTPRAQRRAQVNPLNWFLRFGSALAAAVFVIAIWLDLAGLSAPPAQSPAPATQAALVVPPTQSEDSIAADAARVAPAESEVAVTPGPAADEQPIQAMRQAAESAAEAPEEQPAPESAQPMLAPKAAPQVTPATTPEAVLLQSDTATETPVTQPNAPPTPQSTETPQSPNVMTHTGEPAAQPATQPDTTPWWRMVAGVALVLAVSLGVLGWRRS
jgi:hypothetical protein